MDDDASDVTYEDGEERGGEGAVGGGENTLVLLH